MLPWANFGRGWGARRSNLGALWLGPQGVTSFREMKGEEEIPWKWPPWPTTGYSSHTLTVRRLSADRFRAQSHWSLTTVL